MRKNPQSVYVGNLLSHFKAFALKVKANFTTKFTILITKTFEMSKISMQVRISDWYKM